MTADTIRYFELTCNRYIEWFDLFIKRDVRKYKVRNFEKHWHPLIQDADEERKEGD